MSSSGNKAFKGSYRGNGTSHQEQKPGFRPRYLEIIGVTELSKATKSGEMADESYIVQYKGAGTDGQIELLGQTPGADEGISFNDDGFTVGSDAKINTSASIYHYEAWE